MCLHQMQSAYRTTTHHLDSVLTQTVRVKRRASKAVTCRTSQQLPYSSGLDKISRYIKIQQHSIPRKTMKLYIALAVLGKFSECTLFTNLVLYF